MMSKKPHLRNLDIDVTDSTNVDDSNTLASAKSVSILNNNLTQLEQTVNEHSADNVRHVSQNEKDVWNNKLDKTGGVVTGDITINKGIPTLAMTVPGRENDKNDTRIFWNASTSSDFGLYFRVAGVDTLFLRSDKRILDGNTKPVYTGTSVTVSQTPPQSTLANDAIHMVY